MTGFGKAKQDYNSKSITVEIKALNSKQLDIIFKLPNEIRSLEYEIRNKIGTQLQRGKIELGVTIEDSSQEGGVIIDKTAVVSYVKQVKQLSEAINLDLPQDLISLILKFPGVFKNIEDAIDENLTEIILKTIQEAFNAFDAFRVQEGLVLKNDLLKRINIILSLLEQVEPYEKNRHTTIRNRLVNNLTEFSETAHYDENRFEQELIYYLEKLDITEEKVRLKQHCNYFTLTIDEDNAGKKLGFISQEIGREINTLGSKANEANIQRLVVQMKDELEKIKEQLFNIL